MRRRAGTAGTPFASIASGCAGSLRSLCLCRRLPIRPQSSARPAGSPGCVSTSWCGATMRLGSRAIPPPCSSSPTRAAARRPCSLRVESPRAALPASARWPASRLWLRLRRRSASRDRTIPIQPASFQHAARRSVPQRCIRRPSCRPPPQARSRLVRRRAPRPRLIPAKRAPSAMAPAADTVCRPVADRARCRRALRIAPPSRRRRPVSRRARPRPPSRAPMAARHAPNEAADQHRARRRRRRRPSRDLGGTGTTAVGSHAPTPCPLQGGPSANDVRTCER